jgi:hypothetical protein
VESRAECHPGIQLNHPLLRGWCEIFPTWLDDERFTNQLRLEVLLPRVGPVFFGEFTAQRDWKRNGFLEARKGSFEAVIDGKITHHFSITGIIAMATCLLKEGCAGEFLVIPGCRCNNFRPVSRSCHGVSPLREGRA